MLLSLHPATICLSLFRLSHYFWRNGHRKAARLLFNLNSLLSGGDIHPQNDIAGGLLIPHPTGCALMCSAGRNLAVLSRSGSGMLPKQRDVGAGPGVALLGDDCIIGPICGVEGPQRVGDRVHLLTGLPLTRDVPDDRIVESASPPEPGQPPAPARVAREESSGCRHRGLRETLRDYRADLDAHQIQARGRTGEDRFKQRVSALLTTQMATLGLYRLSHWLYCRGWSRSARGIAWVNRYFSRATINPASCVGGGWFLPHPAGVLFNARAGRNLTLFAYTIASSADRAFIDSVEHGPSLGDDVALSAHSAILGPVRIGDNVRLGFSAHVHTDVPGDRFVSTAMTRPRLRPREDARDGRGTAPAAQTPKPDGFVATQGTAGRQRMVDALRCDWERLLDEARPAGVVGRMLLRLSPAWLCVRLYRSSHRAYYRGQRRRAQLLWQLNMALTGADLRPWSVIGPGLLVPYPPCVSVNGHAGRNLTVMAMAGIDPPVEDCVRPTTPTRLPVLGDEVTLEHHTGVLGPVRIGDRVRLLPGARVTFDVAEEMVMRPARTRVHRRPRTTPPLAAEGLHAQPADQAGI